MEGVHCTKRFVEMGAGEAGLVPGESGGGTSQMWGP